MSNYDVEMVKKFATLNKELIEKTAKDHPEIGGLIKQIIESITEESIPTTTTGAPEETDVMWIPIQEAEDMKTLYKNKTITEQLEAVGRFMGSEKLFKLNLKEKSDLLISMLLMGDFYKLSNDPTKRQQFVETYKQPLEDYETAIQYRINPALKEILGQDIVKPLGKEFVFDLNFLETMGAFFPRRADLSDDELLELSKVLKNITVFNFLRNLGKDGFWYSDEAVWFKPSVVAKEAVVLNDEFGNRLEFDPDYLGVELGINLFPAPKPKFSMGDKVKPTQSNKGEVGTIIGRTWIDNKKNYEYEVELSNTVKSFLDSELEKVTKAKTKAQTKATLPTPSTPQEIEISLMSKDQLKQLKEEFEETLTYLDDTDPEKNDLLGQIKFLNLYLEN